MIATLRNNGNFTKKAENVFSINKNFNNLSPIWKSPRKISMCSFGAPAIYQPICLLKCALWK